MITPTNLVTERAFLHRVLAEALARGWARREDRTLVTCGGPWDERVLDAAGLDDHLVTSLGDASNAGVRSYQEADAEALPFPDESFDLVLVHAGLHHCHSPHRALAEMYRVARRTVLFVESQDSALMRVAVAAGLTAAYELDAVRDHGGLAGGVRNGPVPNHVYRWTRREVEKAVRSLDPAREPRIAFFRGFAFHACHLEGSLGRHPVTRLLGPALTRRVAETAVAAADLLLGWQGNQFAAVIRKSEAPLQPWLERGPDGTPRLTG